MRRSSSNVVLVLIVLLVIVGVIAYLASRNKTPATGSTETPGSIAALGKPKPIANVFDGCPPSGDGGDPVLNTLKNRIDEAQWQSVSVASLLALTWPPAIERQPRF